MSEETRTSTLTSTNNTARGLTGSTTEGARITGTAHQDDRSGPGPEVMAASDFEGEDVVNHDGETLGDIEEIMLEVRTGRIAYAVLAAGGFLGLGEKYFAVPWRALTLDTDRKCFILDVDKERMKKAPSFDRDHWPSMADERWASDVHAYYGTAGDLK